VLRVALGMGVGVRKEVRRRRCVKAENCEIARKEF
jgi:hypothetical protein